LRHVIKTAFALITLILTAAAAELPLPPGAVMAVQVERPAALVGLASELKIPGLPVALLGKLSAIAYATYPGDQTVLVFEAESPEALDLMQPLVQLAAKKQYTARMGNRMVIAPNAAFVRPGLDASPLYRAAKKAASPDSAAWAFLNMAAPNQYPPTRKALADSGSWLEILLNGPIKEPVRNSHWLALRRQA
jgi:hypothetical protein